MSTKDKKVSPKKASPKKGKPGQDQPPVVITAGKQAEAPTGTAGMANIMDDLSKKQAFKKFSWRGKDIMQMLGMKMPEFA